MKHCGGDVHQDLNHLGLKTLTGQSNHPELLTFMWRERLTPDQHPCVLNLPRWGPQTRSEASDTRVSDRDGGAKGTPCNTNAGSNHHASYDWMWSGTLTTTARSCLLEM